MSLSLFSEDGWAANLSSSYALTMLASTVATVGIPELSNFINEGCTDKIPQVVDDLNVLIPKISDIATKGVAEKLRNGLNKIKDKEVAIISQ